MVGLKFVASLTSVKLVTTESCVCGTLLATLQMSELMQTLYVSVRYLFQENLGYGTILKCFIVDQALLLLHKLRRTPASELNVSYQIQTTLSVRYGSKLENGFPQSCVW